MVLNPELEFLSLPAIFFRKLQTTFAPHFQYKFDAVDWNKVWDEYKLTDVAIQKIASTYWDNLRAHNTQLGNSIKLIIFKRNYFQVELSSLPAWDKDSREKITLEISKLKKSHKNTNSNSEKSKIDIALAIPELQFKKMIDDRDREKSLLNKIDIINLLLEKYETSLILEDQIVRSIWELEIELRKASCETPPETVYAPPINSFLERMRGKVATILIGLTAWTGLAWWSVHRESSRIKIANSHLWAPWLSSLLEPVSMNHWVPDAFILKFSECVNRSFYFFIRDPQKSKKEFAIPFLDKIISDTGINFSDSWFMIEAAKFIWTSQTSTGKEIFFQIKYELRIRMPDKTIQTLYLDNTVDVSTLISNLENIKPINMDISTLNIMFKEGFLKFMKMRFPEWNIFDIQINSVEIGDIEPFENKWFSFVVHLFTNTWEIILDRLAYF